MPDPTFSEKLWSFFLSGGVFMACIVLCSFVAVAVSIHRALTLKWSAIIPYSLRGDLHRCDERFAEGQAPRILSALENDGSPVGRIGQVALSPEFRKREEASDAVEATAKEQMVRLENGMGVLEVVITIAPLLGLLGTVSGLVGVFATLGVADSPDPSRIAAGIATALNTTIAGLVVAVITVILHSYFTRRLERIASRLEVIAGHLLHEFYKHGGPSLYPEEEVDPLGRGATDPALVQAIEETDREVQQSDFPK